MNSEPRILPPIEAGSTTPRLRPMRPLSGYVVPTRNLGRAIDGRVPQKRTKRRLGKRSFWAKVKSG